MTLVLASVFDEGKMVLSDSRATSGSGSSSDILQKIVGINENIVVGYAGDVGSVNRVLTVFQQTVVDESLSPDQAISALSEISTQEIGTYLRSFSLLLFTKANRNWKISKLESPLFEPEEISDITLIGSGAIIEPQIVPFYDSIKDNNESLKIKAQRVVWNVSSLLTSAGAPGVGGMIQALLLLPDGVQTLHTGFIDMNPEGEQESKEIRFEKGRWVQHNFRDNTESVIIAPGDLMSQPVHERVFHSYETATGGETGKWYLNSFLTAQNIELEHSSAIFTNQFTAAGCEQFPQTMQIFVYLSLWGSSTEHTLELIHKDPDGNLTSMYSGTFDNQDFPLEYEFLEKLPFTINMAGKHYLDCIIDGESAGSKLIFVTGASPDLPDAANAFNSLSAHHNATDDTLRSSELTYFFVGMERSEQQPMSMKIKGQFRVAYTINYPLVTAAYANFGIRTSAGTHNFTIEMMDAATHEILTTASSTAESSSTTFTKPVEVKFDLKFPKKGFYFVLLKIDGILKGCTVLMADGVPPMTYNLPDGDLAGVRRGGVHLLAKRSLQQND